MFTLDKKLEKFPKKISEEEAVSLLKHVQSQGSYEINYYFHGSGHIGNSFWGGQSDEQMITKYYGEIRWGGQAINFYLQPVKKNETGFKGIGVYRKGKGSLSKEELSMFEEVRGEVQSYFEKDSGNSKK